jgi:cellulose synthase/poly-beta-1,6-N-acetylglucosamine synthase-like glycosyltransferase
MIALFHMLDSVLFYLFLISVLYLFFFAFLSIFRSHRIEEKPKKTLDMLVIFPAYKEDLVILESVKSFLNQDYPADKMEVVVVSDSMSDDTNQCLSRLPITLLTPDHRLNSKANALKYAISNMDDRFDVVVILDADNHVEPSFLHEINKFFYSGSLAVQAHRKARNLNTPMAVLDAISEEINNTIFRKGHVNLGFSSALIGSGMAIDYKWFAKNVVKLSTAGEDKELEILLLKDKIFIDYLDHVTVLDEKIQSADAFYNQRRRWIASQAGALVNGVKLLPGALAGRNTDLLNKIFQQFLLPRVVMLGLIGIFAVLTTILEPGLSLKWWGLLALLLFSFALAVPDELVTKENIKSVRLLPLIFMMMIMNFFRIKGANKNFIHTQKGINGK